MIVLVVIQGAFQILNIAKIPRINYLEIKKNILEFIEMWMPME